MELIRNILARKGRTRVGGAPEGYDAWLAGDLAAARKGTVLHIARDESRAAAFEAALRFFAPDLEVQSLPAWDCLPYDRLGPRTDLLARRIAVLSELAKGKRGPQVLVTTVSALLQRVPPRAWIDASRLAIKADTHIGIETLTAWLDKQGYTRAGSVVEAGDYAVRGGIVDLFAPGLPEPVRVDFFGDQIESLRTFDPESQKSTGRLAGLELLPVSEAPLDPDSVSRFRTGYIQAFGAQNNANDPLYESVSARRRYQGMEHWLPLFHARMETILDYVPDARLTFDSQVEESIIARLEQIDEYYDARVSARDLAAKSPGLQVADYKPLPPDRLYLSRDNWAEHLEGRDALFFSAFDVPDGIDAGGRPGRDFAPERTQSEGTVFDAVVGHIQTLAKAKKRVVLAGWTEGSADRLGTVLADHGLAKLSAVASLSEINTLPAAASALAILPLERGFEARGFAVIGEQDILGDRLIRTQRKTKRAANFLAEAAALTVGDLVVHVDHGIGRYLGLQTIEVLGAPHDCLELQYDGGKLFLPVENIELLTRFGSDAEGIQLDRLGGAGWQSRKAKLKNRIREIAADLIRIAAERAMKKAPTLDVPQGLYDEFAARFPFDETEDQARAISDTMEDFARGQPMDRLVCGDVGFGKTEVALRAAFVAAMSGKQVAVVVPTTLLARQHYKTFSTRFAGWPLQVRQLSRLVTAKEATETKKELAEGKIDIVVGTHALLAKSISFKSLGLVIVDEEQHFGVVHKERLKNLKTDVHVLTLTATPIPRTLQLALSGVRDMSLIASPPVDRLAVRTYVGPLDPVTIREALLREHYRGGQSFYVVPRIADLAETLEFLKETVPEVRVTTAHGQLPPGQLDDVMNAFYDRKFDVLLSTTIVESGLDIPTANTMVVHRADMFGLAQLYQLRGRIGRSKVRAYAYLTTPAGRLLNETAERRLRVLQSLDALGAGFTLASHDLDIRGAGNLLGDEQSGHIREVGMELYQEMLEEAVANLRAGRGEEADTGEWSPQINLGASVLIPEAYVPDLDTRMSLYRRLSGIEDQAEINAFAAELVDRFGKLPDEVEQLLQIVSIKRLCRLAAVEKIDAGPKGAVITFRNNTFANPAGLMKLITDSPKTLKVRPDQKVVVIRDWTGTDDRLKGAAQVLRRLADLAAA
ncbi:Transcription-repair-coupling factor [Alphaproteobacteria bacterium SO-S41]|nr:Transcription-repair-coupling factor [Alphaproteobacteria bacterium SO-S41]